MKEGRKGEMAKERKGQVGAAQRTLPFFVPFSPLGRRTGGEGCDERHQRPFNHLPISILGTVHYDLDIWHTVG